jgi:HAMP domain-containing protein
MDTCAGTEAATAIARHGKRRVRNYLLDTSLQLRLAAYLIVVAIVLCGALGWLLWNAYAETSRIVALTDPDLAAILAGEDRTRIVWLAGGLVLVLVVLLGGTLVVTHRIAGPAYALARTCREVAEGKLAAPRPLRSGDLLQELADDVSEMVRELRAREERERTVLAEAAARLRVPPPDGADRARALDDLDRLAAEKSQRLGR